MPQDVGIDQLNTLIKAANAGWQAGVTSVSELPPDQQRNHLGYVPSGGEESLEQRIQASTAKLGSIQAASGNGSVTLRCRLARPWEPDRPREVFHLSLTVN